MTRDPATAGVQHVGPPSSGLTALDAGKIYWKGAQPILCINTVYVAE